ncbi:MAG: Hsp20/alpha crystallin family protein [Candidatus Lambdaproteobacteria bacterium]|nr:Hsp20/alpha crystallin family protein [Candidatus Lambdaproteobacteria bacterium]
MASKDSKPAESTDPRGSEPPMVQFQKRMGELFDEFFRGRDFSAWPVWGREPMALGSFSPRMDVSEDDKAVTVTLELPGLEEKELEVALTDDALTIKGEKKEEREQTGKDFIRRERSYGSFTRVVTLDAAIEHAEVKAAFKNGVLTVRLPMSRAAQKSVRRIPIQG